MAMTDEERKKRFANLSSSKFLHKSMACSTADDATNKALPALIVDDCSVDRQPFCALT
jgi:hypothetical protein